MSKPNLRPDMDFTPVRNGMDYLISAVKNLTEGSKPPSDRDLKYAVLHLQAATEVLLKARLVREHWTLVFKDPGGANLDVFRSGKFDSCTIGTALDRLANIAQVPIAAKDRAAIKALSDDRNALTHYGHTANAFQVEARAARVLSFLLTFIHRHLQPRLSSEGPGVMRTMDTLRMKLSDIQALVKDRMNELSGELAPLVDRTVLCPDCRQWALVVGEENPACRFCMQDFGDPLNAAANYGWQVLGEDNFSMTRCPACTRAQVIIGASTASSKDVEIGLCFGCAEVYVESKPADSAGGIGPASVPE
ncbi:hypothetical protein [Streptomyces sp. NPDC054865]